MRDDPPALQRAPAVTAYLLAPALAELLTGSAPPREFFNPPTLLLLTTLYGCGVLVCHELAQRWRTGWAGLLWLGAAFGVVAEGLLTRSFYSPDWPELGLLAAYGRSGGVNWTWAACLIVFHAVVSIALPVLVVELVWPTARGRRWVDDASLQMLLMGLLAVTIYGAVTSGARAAPAPYAGGVALAAVLAGVGRRVRLCPADRAPARSPRRVGLQAALAQAVLLGAIFVIPLTKPPPLFAVSGLGIAVWLVARRFRETVAAGWSERHRFALVAGLTGVWMLLAPLQELDPARADDASGLTLAALAALAGLLWLRRQVLTRDRRHAWYDGGGVAHEVRTADRGAGEGPTL